VAIRGTPTGKGEPSITMQGEPSMTVDGEPSMIMGGAPKFIYPVGIGDRIRGIKGNPPQG